MKFMVSVGVRRGKISATQSYINTKLNEETDGNSRILPAVQSACSCAAAKHKL